VQQYAKFNKKVQNDEREFGGSSERIYFCNKEKTLLTKFNFDDFLSSLHLALKDSIESKKEHYQRFYCILCDGESQ